MQCDEANRESIGAQIRLELEGKLGPARTIRLGSGYLSQSATTQVLGGAEKATALLVAWPSGGRERFKLTPGQSAITAVKEQGNAVPD